MRRRQRKSKRGMSLQRSPTTKRTVLEAVSIAIAVFLIVGGAALLFMTGCRGTETTYIEFGEPVQLRQDIEDVKVWIEGEHGEASPATVTLRKGWWCLPLISDDGEVYQD